MGDEKLVYTRGTPEVRAQLAQQQDRRRVLPENRKTFNAKQLWDKYQEIARRLILGQKNVQIAQDLNMTAEAISCIRNSEIVKEHIASLQGCANERAVDVASRIKGLAPQALDLLESIIVDGQVGEEKLPAKLRADHAEKLLDRAGYVAPREINARHLHGHYTAEDIERIKARAVNRATDSNVIEVDS